MYIFRQVFLAAVDLADNRGGRIGRVAVIYAVDIAKDNQSIHSHHGGDQSGKLVIVREHQFCNRYRVVFVHDGNHFIFEHYLHTMFLVEVMRAAAKVLFRGEHLATGHAMFAEQFVIPVDQLGLPDCGIQLAGRDGIQLFAGLYLTASRSDRTGGNKDDFHAFPM